MKISQEDGILIKSLYLSKQYGDWCTNVVAWISRLGSETWKHRQSAKENPQYGYNCPATTQLYIERLRYLAVEDLVLSQDDKPKVTISSWDFVWNVHSLFKCAQDDSPALTLQTASCSAIVWSQSHLPSHSHALIISLIVCNISCYCSILNRKLNI